MSTRKATVDTTERKYLIGQLDLFVTINERLSVSRSALTYAGRLTCETSGRVTCAVLGHGYFGS